MEIEPNKGVFEYEVRFEPQAHLNQLRYALLKQQIPLIGQTRIFDGVKLCLPIQLQTRFTQLKSTNPNDNSEVIVTIIYKGRKNFADCQQFYGILFANIMKTLKFIRFGTKDFDPKQPKAIPQHNLEIWPGYVTGMLHFVENFQQLFNYFYLEHVIFSGQRMLRRCYVVCRCGTPCTSTNSRH